MHLWQVIKPKYVEFNTNTHTHTHTHKNSLNEEDNSQMIRYIIYLFIYYYYYYFDTHLNTSDAWRAYPSELIWLWNLKVGRWFWWRAEFVNYPWFYFFKWKCDCRLKRGKTSAGWVFDFCNTLWFKIFEEKIKIEEPLIPGIWEFSESKNNQVVVFLKK